MISFNTSQTLLFNVGIDIFSICVMLILIVICKWDTLESYNNQILFRMQIAILVTLVTDMFMWAVNGIPGAFWRIVGYADSIIYFLFQLLMLLEWSRYAYFRIYEKYLSKKAELFALLIPLSILGLCVVTTPLTGWCFYLDEENFYHRGFLLYPIMMIILGYLFAVSVAALVRRKKETLFDRKRECFVLSFFVIPPLLGGCIQYVFYGCNLVCPCVTLSALILFITAENQAISLDALTRLNNRGNLDRYLYTSLETGQTVSLIMLDINNFKAFNDRYGHAVGDTALIQTAGMIKNAFRDTSAFLSRYGGDEFVIVLTECEEQDVERAVEKLRESIELFNETHALPAALSVSIGFTVITISDASDISRLLKEADEHMYREKRDFHKVDNPGNTSVS